MSYSDTIETIAPVLVAFFFAAGILAAAVVACLISAVKR